MIWLLTLVTASETAAPIASPFPCQQAEVNYQCLSKPNNLIASALSTTQVSLSWTASPGVIDHYQVERSLNVNGPFTVIGPNVKATSFVDSGVSGGITYLYLVRAADASNTRFSDYSNIDLATTIVFTDSLLSLGVTEVKAVHFTELRQAVNAVRVAANLGQFNWPEPIQLQVTTIKAPHLQELRNNLDLARSTIGVPAQSYTDNPVGPGVTIKKAYVDEIRLGVR
jgi:hypothetical protein